MRIISVLPACFISFFQFSATSPLVQTRDAPFESVRTRLDRDFSKSNDVESEKYFREARFASHYDGRLADPRTGLPGKTNAFEMSDTNVSFHHG